MSIEKGTVYVVEGTIQTELHREFISALKKYFMAELIPPQRIPTLKPAIAPTVEVSEIKREEVPKVREAVLAAGEVPDVEELYEAILKRLGYSTERRIRFGAAAGGEIDVLGLKSDEAVVVECRDGMF